MPRTARLSRSRTAVRARHAQAFALRQRGRTYTEIARELGYVGADGQPLASAARYAVKQYQARIDAGLVTATVGGVEEVVLTRRFGVEIECFGISKYEAHAAIHAADVSVEVEDYNHRTVGHWKIVHDGSVSGSGLEIVSPPLSGPAGLEDVRTVMTALREAGATVNRSCGLHVHHEIVDLTGDQIAALATAWHTNQAAIDLLVARSRRGQQEYIGPFQDNELPDLLAYLRQRQVGYVTRYRNLNFQSYPRYGTVEVRQHQGTLSGDKAVAWIRFTQALIAAVAVDAVPQTNLATLLDVLVCGHHLAESVRAYLLRRARALGADDAAIGEVVEPAAADAEDARADHYGGPHGGDCGCDGCDGGNPNDEDDENCTCPDCVPWDAEVSPGVTARAWAAQYSTPECCERCGTYARLIPGYAR
ncbi:MAG: amidoligase family protein [Actinomycetota bacterium]